MTRGKVARTTGACLFLTVAPAVGTESKPAAQDVEPLALQLTPVLAGLSNPLYAGGARDGTNRLFIVEQTGRILMLQPGSATPAVFLDIGDRIILGSERGLLGLAFHPDFENNRRFFVNYTRTPDGATVIAEYRASLEDGTVANRAQRTILVVAQPFSNHNAGMIEFGRDGFLYVALGDGGSGNDPGNRSQNLNELLGKMLRIDVDSHPGGAPYASPSTNPFFGSTPGRDEIYAVGFRNPFRFSFDRLTGNLWLGDVGQGPTNPREEIDVVTLGGNYGWRVFEGSLCTPNDPALCNPANYIFPVTEYDHGDGKCAVTGGYVYRGARGSLPTGAYLYGDFCTGEIFQLLGGSSTRLMDTALNISSFGEDEAGELYVTGLGGTVDRVIDSASTCSAAISPGASPTYPGEGGTGTIAVTAPAGCAWTAVSNVGWLSITSGASVAGSGTVTYAVASTVKSRLRTGTLSVAGHTFRVTQRPDTDGDRLPDVLEAAEGRNRGVKDNDVFANNRLFPMQQYRDFLDREGEPSGVSAWTGFLSSGGTRRGLVVAFMNSGEFRVGNSEVVTLLYASFLRIPTDREIRFWVEQRRLGESLPVIADYFALTPEFASRYGSLDNNDFVVAVYQNLLGRDPEPDALVAWRRELDNGNVTRGAMILGVSRSSEYLSRPRPAYSVFVAQLYSALLGRTAEAGGFNAWVAFLESGGPAEAVIQGFLDSGEYRARFLP